MKKVFVCLGFVGLSACAQSYHWENTKFRNVNIRHHVEEGEPHNKAYATLGEWSALYSAQTQALALDDALQYVMSEHCKDQKVSVDRMTSSQGTQVVYFTCE